MPIYEYQCEKCGTFELTQRITDSPLRRCPKCRAKVQKLISQTSFQLKGSGWYVTDYASKDSGASKDNGASEEKSGSKAAPASGESGGEKSGSDKSPTKTGSKTEATAA